MAINVYPGAVGPGFGSILAGALNQLFGLREQEAEKRTAKEERDRQKALQDRQNALQNLSTLINLHGPDVVNLPQFGELYKQIFGKDYPTEDVEIPGQPAVTRKIPVPTVPGGVQRAEEPGAPYGAKPPQVGGEAEEEVTPAIPSRRVTRPLPLGGGSPVDPTAAEMGLPLPGPMGQLRLSQLKALGFDIDTIIKQLFKTDDPIKLEDQKAQVMAKFLRDPTKMTPQEQAVIAWMMGQDKPQSLNDQVWRQVIQSGGDLTKLDPGTRWYVENVLQRKDREKSYKEQIVEKARKQGLNSLSQVESMIFFEEIVRPKNVGEYSKTDLERDLILGKVRPEQLSPYGQQWAQSLIKGTTAKFDETGYRQLQQKYFALLRDRAALIARISDMRFRELPTNHPDWQVVRDQLFQTTAKINVMKKLIDEQDAQRAVGEAPKDQPPAGPGRIVTVNDLPPASQYPNAVLTTPQGTKHRSVYRNGKWVWEPPVK